MITWLKSIWNSFSGSVTDLYHWILQVLQAVYTFIDDEITSLWNSAVSLYNAAIIFTDSVYSWAIGQINGVEAWAVGWFNFVISWASGLINQLWSYATSVMAWAVRETQRIWDWITSTIANIITWVLNNIWDPLWNAITGALRWIEQYGQYLWNLITHPELLAALLGTYLISAWMALAQKFAKPFAKWLMSTVIGSAGFIGGILEDMISAIL